MKTICVSQARISSSRLPEKVLIEYAPGKTYLDLHLQRLKKVKGFDAIVVAIAQEAGCERIVEVCERHSVECYLGSVNDVLDRFYQAILPYSPDHVARVTSDCPLIDPKVCDLVIESHVQNNNDYTSNVLAPTWPDGLDFEILTFKALKEMWSKATEKKDREHVTLYIRDAPQGKFQMQNIKKDQNDSDLRMTLDNKDDLILLNKIIAEIGEFSKAEEYINYLRLNEDIKKINQHHERNEVLKR